MKRVICIAGKAKSGKDSAAFFLKQHFEEMGRSAIIVHYADYLKYICKKYYAWNGEKDANGRTLLQMVGQRGREGNPYFWVNTLKSTIEYTLPEHDYIIIADTRYPEEIEYWLDDPAYTTLTLKITTVRDNGLTYEQLQHPSETALDEYPYFNYYIQNDSTLEHLYYMTGTLAKDIEEGIYERIYKWF